MSRSSGPVRSKVGQIAQRRQRPGTTTRSGGGTPSGGLLRRGGAGGLLRRNGGGGLLNRVFNGGNRQVHHNRSNQNVRPQPPVNNGGTTPTPPVNNGGTTPTPPVNNGGTTPTPPVNNGGRTTPTPPVNNGGTTPTPPVNNGGTAPTPPVNNGGTTPTPPVNNGGTTPTPPVNNGGATPTPPVNNGGAAPTPPGRYGDHRDVAPSLFGATPDGNQIHAWKQGGTGNCASIACIKAATDAYGKEGVFDGVTKREDGGFDLKLQDGRSVSLTAKELETAKRYSQFHELGKGTDLEHAQLTYGAMAKNKQELMGYRSFESALSSLNDGENPRDAARWLGIPKDRIQELTSKGVAGQDSIVAWNNRHAVFVDRALGQGGKESHQYDLYGRAMDYGSGSRLETRRGRFGRTYQVQVGGNPYPNAFGFSPRPQPTPPVNGGGAAPQPPVNNGGGGAVVPPVNNGGGGGAVVPPVNNGGGAVVPPVNSGGGGAVVPPVNGGGGAAPVTDTTPKPPAEVAFDHTRYQDALKAAHESGRPLVMKVGASWCGPCQAMKRGAFADPAVQKMLADRGVFLDVENDRHGDTAQQQAMAQQISQQLGVRSYPTTMIANVIERDGSYVPQVIDQRAGMMGAQQLQAFLAQALEQ